MSHFHLDQLYYQILFNLFPGKNKNFASFFIIILDRDLGILRFTELPEPEVIFSNNTGIILTCRVSSLEPVRIQWWFPQSRVRDQQGLIKVLGNSSLYYYKFPSSRFQPSIHQTSVRCSAANQHGKIISPSFKIQAGRTLRNVQTRPNSDIQVSINSWLEKIFPVNTWGVS